MIENKSDTRKSRFFLKKNYNDNKICTPEKCILGAAEMVKNCRTLDKYYKIDVLRKI